MGKLLQHLCFSRILATVLCANFVSLVFLNLFEMKVYQTGFIYALFFLAIYPLILRFRVKMPIKIDRVSFVLILLMFILLALPRFTYFLDWLPDNTVITICDDYARLAELISMTQSQYYPLKHPGNQHYLLSFYYTALYPFAMLKFIFPMLTLKNCVAISNLLYHALLLLSFVEVAHVILRDYIAVRVFIYLCTLFGGLDWLMLFPTAPWGHFEWWQGWFHGNAQISSFFTGMFWSVHAFTAFYATILAYVFFFYTAAYQRRGLKQFIVLLLAASAFYSCPFSVFPVPLFLLIHYRTYWKHLVRSWMFVYIVILMVIPLFIFLGRFPLETFVPATFRFIVTGQFWIDKVLSFPIFLILVPLIEFAGIPFFLIFRWKQLSRSDKQYLLAGGLFFVITYVVAYSGANNFSMRGMLLPTWVLFALFAKHWSLFCKQKSHVCDFMHRKTVVAALIVLTILGTLKESAGKVYLAIHDMRLYYTFLYEDTFPEYETYLPPRLDKRISQFVHNSSSNPINKNDLLLYDKYKYNLERMIKDLDLEEMEMWEKEILRFPRKGMFY